MVDFGHPQGMPLQVVYLFLEFTTYEQVSVLVHTAPNIYYR